MKFTKMQGCGNDYVYINCFIEKVADPNSLAKQVSDRHFGIGSDGLILIKPSEVADFKMEMYNSDGSQGEMCGNAIRCVGKYVYEKNMTKKEELRIETLAGIRELFLTIEEGKVPFVTVDMGAPSCSPAAVPMLFQGEAAIDVPVLVEGKEYLVTGISLGNPHGVIFVEEVASFPLSVIGPKFEQHEIFPERANIEFVERIDRTRIKMRVWERGSGETFACGTGATASAYACILHGYTEEKVTVEMLGGSLTISFDKEKQKLFMTGPAVTVFEGTFYEKEDF